MPSHSPSVARSALWNHAGRLTDYVAWYCSSVLIARGLGVELNGILAGMMSGVHLLLAFSSLGLEVAVNKFIPQIVGDDVAPRARAIIRRAALARLLFYLLICGVFLLGFRWVVGEQPGLTIANLALLLFYGFFRGLAPLAAVVLVVRWRADRAAIINGITRLLELGALIVLYSHGMSLLTVIGILTATFAVQCIGYVVAAREYWFGNEVHAPMRPIWIFGLIFWINTVVDFFLGRQGGVLFLSLLSPSSSSVGLYDVAYSVLQAGSMVVTVGFSTVTLAAFARHALGDRARMDSFYGSLVRITTLLMVPVLGLLFVIAPAIVKLLYSDSYAGAIQILQLMLALRILARLFGGGENSDYLIAINKVHEVVGVGLVGMGISIVMYVSLIPEFDALGAAFAGGVGTLATNVLGVLRVRRYGSASIQWQTWVRVTTMTLVAGVAAALLPFPGSAAAAVVGRCMVFAAVVAGGALLLRPLTSVDAEAVFRFSPLLNRLFKRIS